MLILSRKKGEKIFIGSDIVLTISDVNGGQVKLGIEAPRSLTIIREELSNKPKDKEDQGAKGV